LLVNAILPLTLPPFCGAKVTVKAELCPGVNVVGNVSALTPKPAPMAVTLVTVTLVPPEFVMVAGWLWVLPTATLPKLRLAGLTAKVPGITPVPVTARLTFEFAAVEAIAIAPVTAPTEDGAKVTTSEEL
jgi:hypothetical protein